jgi:hypothetical protein
MSHHKIRIEFLALTPQRKALFLRWALDGFRFPKLPSRGADATFSERAA